MPGGTSPYQPTTTSKTSTASLSKLGKTRVSVAKFAGLDRELGAGGAGGS